MCILRFDARAGYLQHYEALLKELNSQVPEDHDDVPLQAEPQDQYDVERFALADRNHNLPSETGLRYPSLLVMCNQHFTRYPSLLVMCNQHLTTLRISVNCCSICVHTNTY